MSNLSPAPGVPQTGTKAYIATGIAFVGAFLTALLAQWTDSDPLQARDFIVALAAAIASGVLTGIGAYMVPNQPLQ